VVGRVAHSDPEYLKGKAMPFLSGLGNVRLTRGDAYLRGSTLCDAAHHAL
jgi:hypothetical protein